MALTNYGRGAAILPLPVHQAVALLQSLEPSFGCSVQIAQIVSLQSVESIFDLPSTDAYLRSKARKVHAGLKDVHGDHMTKLRIWQRFEAKHRSCGCAGGCSKSANEHPALLAWCKSLALDCAALLEVGVFHSSLVRVMESNKMPLRSLNLPLRQKEAETILRALLRGHFINLAFKDGKEEGDVYANVDNQRAFLHPDNPGSYAEDDEYYECVIYDTLFSAGNRQYFLAVSGIALGWLFESVRLLHAFCFVLA